MAQESRRISSKWELIDDIHDNGWPSITHDLLYLKMGLAECLANALLQL